MPLHKAAKPGSKGFKENIKTEIAVGKPQKQAVAIAYSESRQHKEHKMKHEHKAEKTKEEHKKSHHEQDAHKKMHSHHKEMHKHHMKEIKHHEKMMHHHTKVSKKK